MRIRGLGTVVACVALAAAPAALAAAAPQLFGTVGPGFTIKLNDASGARVTQVDPGTYEITVSDQDIEHNFHLSGPGVNESTKVETEGTVTWTVTLQNGRYKLLCDVHPTSMRQDFVAGTPPSSPPPVAAVKKLTLTVGPAASIVLSNPAGKRVTAVKAGDYSIAVRDRSKVHNAHLVGKGVNRKSGLAATGTLTWKVKLSAGPLRFFSDRSPKTVKGQVKVT